MIKSRNPRMKSRIAVMKGSSLENKENVPYDSTKKENVNTIQQYSNRKIPYGRKSVYTLSKKAVKSRKAKSAPDFEKVHRKWESKLAKNKAMKKRPNTKVEPFNLTNKAPSKYKIEGRNYEIQDDLLDEFAESDYEDEALPKRSSNQTSDSLQKTDKMDSKGLYTEVDKQITTPASSHEFKVPKSLRKVNLSSIKKESAQSYQDLLDFKPDKAALESILNNVGVDESKIRATPSSNTGYFCSPSPFKQKRTSIYYTDPDPNRPLTGFEQRLISRRATTINELRKGRAVTTPSLKRFEPSTTLVGIQEIGSRFSVTPSRELPIAKECNFNPSIQVENSQDNTVSRSQTTSRGSSDVANLNEMSWADTLKSYLHVSRGGARPTSPNNNPEDAEALIAQLEEEVNRNLAEMQITDHENMSSHKQRPVDDVSSRAMNTEFSQNVLPSFNYSYPLHDGGEKLTVFRELFPSSSSNFIENKMEMNSRELFANSSNTKITSTEKEQSSCKETIAEEKEYPLQSRPQIYRVTDSRPFCAFQEEQTNFKPGSVLAQSVSSVAFSPFPSRDMYCNCRQGRVTQLPRSATATSLLLREKQQASGLFRTQAIQSKKSEVPCIAQRNELNEESMCGFSRPTVSHSSAFTRVHSSDSATSEELFSVAGSRTSKVNEGFEIVVPTPRRPVISNIRPNKVNLNNTIGSEFISRHRQIMLDALEKNRQYAQEILLDAEVSLYARNIEDLRNSELKHRLENPLAKLFNEGDDMHFAPVNE